MNRLDRIVAASLLALCLFVYAYFFQGDGWSLQSNWLTTRQLVEHATFDITPYRERTGDISVYHDRVYSNKPPGLSFVGVPPYWALFHTERFFGADPTTQRVEWRNIRFITWLLCGVPGALLVMMIYTALRRERATPALAAAMCIAFAFGSIAWPFTGMLYNHMLVSACVFGGWLLLRSSQCKHRTVAIAALLLGIATLSEYVIGPLAIFLIAFDYYIKRERLRSVLLVAGVAFGLMSMLWFQHSVFGSALTPSYAYELREIAPADAIAGRFSWPDPRRLYWITFHRFRGLFFNCPVFAVVFLSLLTKRRFRTSREAVVALLVTLYFVTLLMTYRYWSGGSGTGPRFALPALPFLFLLTLRGFQKYPLIAWPLALLSIFNMLAVTAVEANYTGNESGPPQQWDPVGVCTLNLISNRIAISPHSSNLGMKIGLRGTASVIPVVMIILLSLAACLAVHLFAPKAKIKSLTLESRPV